MFGQVINRVGKITDFGHFLEAGCTQLSNFSGRTPGSLVLFARECQENGNMLIRLNFKEIINVDFQGSKAHTYICNSSKKSI